MEEKHKCKVCWKSFVNGRALGGHMRSHMLTLPLPLPSNNQTQLLSTSSSSSSSAEKRLVSMADHECVLQDRESETESSKKPTRKRSRLNRRSIYASLTHQQESSEAAAIGGEAEAEKMMKTNQQQLTESCIDQEPMSSVSDAAAAEEDVAFSLMLLSRDKWGKKEEELDDETEYENWKKKMKKKKCFKCETCDKVFRSYQALGGHRASHKKNKASETVPIQQHQTTIQGSLDKKKKSSNSSSSHECPICFKVFTSGQALGGHKRSHATPVAATGPENSAAIKRGSLIDLNLPAPSEDEDPVSAVFNA